MKATIHKVAKEKIISCGAITSNLEKLFQIPKLTMNVSTHLFHNIRYVHAKVQRIQ